MSNMTTKTDILHAMQANNGFAAFGWYRVILGATILTLLMFRVPLGIVN
jgi:undecaprenyl pyrophosphate phosphatase UppP